MSPWARACLEALVAAGCGALVSLGGALGLAYYLEYRSTADADAWWAPEAGTSERKRVVDTLVATLARFGQTRVRSWGDVVSVELQQEGRVVFSFQIASRSARLEDPVRAPWPEGAYVDRLDDLLASKMEALVSRGAPRDFRDVREVCRRGLSWPAELWRLWSKRREMAGEASDRARAALAVTTHLERIELARPLGSISDAGERTLAQETRAWVREELLHGLV